MSSLASPLAVAVQRYAAQPAIVAPHATLSWTEVGNLVRRIAGSLRAEDVETGDRIALIGQNSVEYALLILGIIEARAIACPISVRLPVQSQTELIARLGARRIDVDAVKLDNYGGMPAYPLSTEWAIDQPATIMFTSGSTGQPKAVVLSIGNHIYNALGSHDNIPFGLKNRWLVTLPFYHVGGTAILFRALAHGGAVAIPETGYDLVESIERLDVSHLSLVSTQLYRLLETEKNVLFVRHALSAILLGGSSTPAGLIDRALEAGLPIHTSYGLTETGSQVCTTGPGDPAEKLFTSGRTLPYRELQIATDGEILVRGRTRLLGYFEDGRVVSPVDPEGWFATGDIGRLDRDGYLCVRGRKDNMFVSGGENIHPEEIEAALCRLPDVVDVVAVPFADDEFGFRPAAFVRVAEDTPFDEARFVIFLERFLPRFKIPDEFFPWPKDAPADTMKPDRRWFAERATELLKP